MSVFRENIFEKKNKKSKKFMKKFKKIKIKFYFPNTF